MLLREIISVYCENSMTYIYIYIYIHMHTVQIFKGTVVTNGKP